MLGFHHFRATMVFEIFLLFAFFCIFDESLLVILVRGRVLHGKRPPGPESVDVVLGFRPRVLTRIVYHISVSYVLCMCISIGRDMISSKIAYRATL